VLEFIKDRELIEANPYKTAKIKKNHLLPAFGINPNMYGGRVYCVSELKDTDLLLIVNKDLETIDVARLKQDKETSVNVEVVAKKRK
jgi:hypothetical protein